MADDEDVVHVEAEVVDDEGKGKKWWKDPVSNVPGDTWAYIALAFGVLLTLAGVPLGSLIIGVVAGIYFYEESFIWFTSGREFLDRQGLPAKLTLIAAVAIAAIRALPLVVGFIGCIAFKSLLKAGDRAAKKR